MKKVYIHTDLEGISGIIDGNMVKVDDPGGVYCNQRLMIDVNAAIDGAFAGGADVVTVSDMHRGGGNFDLDLLDKRAEFDTKAPNPWWGKLDETYCCSFLIGTHAMAGTIGGFLEHTMDSTRIYNMWINGRRAGEIALWGTICGNFNVPLIMVSGDDAAVLEARQFLGDIETVSVKQGINRWEARTRINNDDIPDLIRESAKKVMENISENKIKPFKPVLPVDYRIDFTRSDYCEEWLCGFKNLERIDARSVRILAGKYTDMYVWSDS